MNAQAIEQKPAIFTHVGALSLALTDTEIIPHIFDSTRLALCANGRIPNPLLANLLLDAAAHCKVCRHQLDRFMFS